MHVNVGPFRYEIRLVHGYIRHEGTDCLGLCDNIAQCILISDVPGESQRLQVFFHELMHAWWYHFGVDAADEEAVVDLVGVAMTDFLLQAVRQFRASFSEPSSGILDDTGTPGDSRGSGEPGDADEPAGSGDPSPEGPIWDLPGTGTGGWDGSRYDGGSEGTSTKCAPKVRTTAARVVPAVRPAAAQLRGVIERMLPTLCVEVGRNQNETDTNQADAEHTINTTSPDDTLAPSGIDRDEGWVLSIYDRTSVGSCRWGVPPLPSNRT